MANRTRPEPTIDLNKLPRHLAIIMDGNGRWATRRLMPRQMGHRAGIEALKRVTEAAGELGIPILTVYAFSTENWKRPREEIEFLMRLLLEYADKELKVLHEKNVKIRFIGDPEPLDPEIRAAMERARQLTCNNTGMILNIALNYGGRAEIVHAARRLAEKVRCGQLEPNDISEETIEQEMYTGGMPDPDLLIRTAGEYRVSNFLLWQIAYTEIWVTNVLWPDFDRADLLQAISDYQKRERKFGAVNVGNEPESR